MRFPGFRRPASAIALASLVVLIGAMALPAVAMGTHGGHHDFTTAGTRHHFTTHGARTFQYRTRDFDCSDFTQAEAQRVLDRNRNDPFNLDTDNDGRACEGGFRRVTLARTGTDAFTVALIGGVFVLGALALRRRRAHP